MGFFPTDANDGDEVGPNTNGTFFKYVAVDDKWIIISGVDVYSEAEVDALDHDHFPNPNGNAEEQHMTSNQITALHAKYTNGEVDTRIGLANHDVLQNPNGNAEEQHMTDAQMGNLHSIYQSSTAKTYIEANTKLDDLQTPDNNADLNSTTSEHGLLKLLDNNPLNFMNGQGNWAEPAGVGGISEADVFAYLAIGIGNKRWINLMFQGTDAGFPSFRFGNVIYNVGATNMTLVYGLPLPYIMNGKNLVITRTKVGINLADADDYLDRYRIFAWSDHDSSPTIVDDGTNRTVKGEYIYDHADITIGGVYENLFFYFACFNTGASNLQFSYFKVEYYYV